jgi:alkylation response protein AidB-like acyl-CoA dehydrogenase
MVGCAGLSQPNVGSDFGGLDITAVRVDGGRKLNGAKTRLPLEENRFYVPRPFA